MMPEPKESVGRGGRRNHTDGAAGDVVDLDIVFFVAGQRPAEGLDHQPENGDVDGNGSHAPQGVWTSSCSIFSSISCFSWHATHRCAKGTAFNRFSLISTPQSEHRPYFPSPRRTSASSICWRTRFRISILEISRARSESNSA